MSERREGMVGGQRYRDHAELVGQRRRCRRLIDAFNVAGADDDEQRRAVLDALLGSISASASVVRRFTCSYGDQITIGDHALINYD